MVRRRALGLVAALAFVVSGAACRTSGGSADRHGTLAVVASFYPVAKAAVRVGGDRVDVTNLTPTGVEAHDLELAPDDVEAIATADVVLYLGGGFQPGLEEALGDAEGTVIDVLDGLPTEPAPQTDVVDPHVWLDPELYSAIVDTVERTLASVEPRGADGFASNAAAFKADLAQLDAEFADGLATCERRVIVTAHEAFGYMARAYGLTQEAITGLSPEAEPDARRLAELKAFVEQQGITTIFTEAQVSPEVAETLASEVGVTTAVLNPLESLTEAQADAGEDYGSVMRANLQALRGALDCE